jgi:nucleoside-diphosphate-sugar epimerase
VIRLLAEQGEDVVCVDINPGDEPFREYRDRVRVVRADVGQFDEVSAIVATARPSKIVNLAYLLGGQHAPHTAFKVNVLGMENVLEAARLHGVGRVVFASSLSVSGEQRLHGDRLVAEDDVRLGHGQYAVHKIFNEDQAEDFHAHYGIEVTAIRPANVAGADKIFGSVDHVRCITEPARGRPVTLPYRDLVRCPIHADEVADVFRQIIMADRPKHRVYNTGGEPISLGGIAQIVRGYLPAAQIEFEHDSGGESLSNCYLVDNTRLLEEFDVTIRPYAKQVLQIINEARVAAGLELVEG